MGLEDPLEKGMATYSIFRDLILSSLKEIGKGVCQGCILSPPLFNIYAEYIMQNAGLDEYKLESRLLGEISTTSDMQIIPLQ